jgi:RHH-type rel operon transcriptional repressor/antitoxin RelB
MEPVMAVSVRMDPLLEKDLELAARKRGITKSQFIVDAVRHALGRQNPYDLLLQVQSQPARLEERGAPYPGHAPAAGGIHDGVNGGASPSERLRQKLRAQPAAEIRDWLAYQDAKKRGLAWAPEDPAE